MRDVREIFRSPPALVTDLLGKAVHQAVFLFLHEPLQRFGLFDGREVLAEQVLDQRDFGGVSLHTDPGDGREAGKLGGLEAALAGDEDQVGALGVHPEEKRLDDADALDRCGQLLQRLGIH